MVAAVTGAEAPRLVFPFWAAKADAPAATLFDRIRRRRPLLTPVAMEELKSNPRVSHGKATRELGFGPRPLRDTVTDTIMWFPANSFLK